MAAKPSLSVDLGLADIPEITDPKLFPEFLRVYNAIKILAQALDGYTAGGTITNTIETVEADTGSSITTITSKLKLISSDLSTILDAGGTAKLAELQKQYRRYKVPTFTVVGAFGCNGKTPQVSYALGAVVTNVPVGGVGTAAGGWDTAANRDAAIAAINAHTIAINNIQTALKNNGIGS